MGFGVTLGKFSSLESNTEVVGEERRISEAR